ncbi:hypothetical protein [Paracoccus sp. (in: a-proteobacteria)]|uniref:hypothetical protein n=1 Tax=Paracoccus sp. TaxID=267 RepID=UPI0028B155F1|nr:hypothetical protein [Paracoccus sp. (in: a-proteobacteria)]
MRTDFENLPDRQTVILHPAEANFLHREPVLAVRHGFCIFCEGTDPAEGPDYSMRDVSAFCRGWEVV